MESAVESGKITSNLILDKYNKDGVIIININLFQLSKCLN